jgi:hypothetical protein
MAREWRERARRGGGDTIPVKQIRNCLFENEDGYYGNMKSPSKPNCISGVR